MSRVGKNLGHDYNETGVDLQRPTGLPETSHVFHKIRLRQDRDRLLKPLGPGVFPITPKGRGTRYARGGVGYVVKVGLFTGSGYNVDEISVYLQDKLGVHETTYPEPRPPYPLPLSPSGSRTVGHFYDPTE